ncbi:fumarate hydratase class I, aerobic-like isoform X2 [Ruditapes philippinarum]|uniref:fumarate hydratase class I, aerobic-like isoform X2 n=1 Tax=Ruditapes philippinarum TaxID=129788 RepID=UPI00295B858D|nr:fumarate hydratase class I, aerobic-like isoform X2 [Ruditapes philippinarum]
MFKAMGWIKTGLRYRKPVYQTWLRTIACTASARSDAKPFHFQDILALERPHDVKWKKLTDAYVEKVQLGDHQFLKVEPQALTLLTEQAMTDMAHLFRTSHLQQLSNILKDPEASGNDRYIAMEMLKNACVSAGMVLPGCQDTGTAICIGKKGQFVLTDGKDEASVSRGVYNTYTKRNLRYSQVAPLDLFTEVNTRTNLPAQVEIYATGSSKYDFLFMAKGGGSANKTFLYQQTKALLNPEKLYKFIDEKIKTLGTQACPPYHLAVVIGGTSAEFNLKTVKLATCRYLDTLPTTGNEHGRAFRDMDAEQEILKISQRTGIGAQFGGKYFCHDVRVIRLPRHGASCPVGIGVSCSADRQILGSITEDGVFLEQLEINPAQFLPEIGNDSLSDGVAQINLNKPMSDVLSELNKLKVQSRVNLTGTLIVARDIAHAKLKERLDSGSPLPEYFKKHPVIYAGPSKTPEGFATGSIGPTTGGRMDPYVDEFQRAGGSMVMIAKGNRSKQVVEACKKNGGFYLASIGGIAGTIAQECFKSIELLEYPELGMEAIYKVEVENLPAFLVIDDKGNDFFKQWRID